MNAAGLTWQLKVLNPDHYVEWLSLRSTHPLPGFPGKSWSLVSIGKQCHSHEVLEVKDVRHASAAEGLSVTLLDGDQDEFLVGMTLFRLDTGIYLWVPHYVDFSVKRKGRDDFCVFP